MGKLAPPRPDKDLKGTLTGGTSFKFDSQLAITPRLEAGEADNPVTYDNAFLQLQLMECFAIINKRDDVISKQKREIDSIHNKMKRYVLM